MHLFDRLARHPLVRAAQQLSFFVHRAGPHVELALHSVRRLDAPLSRIACALELLALVEILTRSGDRVPSALREQVDLRAARMLAGYALDYPPADPAEMSVQS
jgi:hypothetical protein